MIIVPAQRTGLPFYRQCLGKPMEQIIPVKQPYLPCSSIHDPSATANHSLLHFHHQSFTGQ
jgi:hypothetical protein